MSQSSVIRFLEADVNCYHCGLRAGRVRRAAGAQFPWTIFEPDGGSGTRITNLAVLRCRRCLGPLYAETFEAVDRFVKGTQPLERPRRGRPPKQPARMAERETA